MAKNNNVNKFTKFKLTDKQSSDIKAIMNSDGMKVIRKVMLPKRSQDMAKIGIEIGQRSEDLFWYKGYIQALRWVEEQLKDIDNLEDDDVDYDNTAD